MAGKRSATALRYAKRSSASRGKRAQSSRCAPELDRCHRGAGRFHARRRPRASDVSAAERRAALQGLAGPLGLSPLLTHFLSFLIDQRRTRDLAAIHEDYVRLAEEAAGRVRGEVVSATPLDPAQLARIRAALARRMGRELDLAIRVDPDLLGGLVARVGDLVFDGSLRTQLAQLRAQLTGER
jgi:F-type H+-transporting ATPase subunit delta